MKVLIADDHSVVREGLKRILKGIETNYFIDEAATGNEALKKIRKNNYDLLILDISMPDIGGLDILQTIRDQKIDVSILVLSMHPQEQYARRAIKLGASGYITKDSAYDELGTAIKKILAGGRYISPAFAEKTLFELGNESEELPHKILSDREFQIMCKLGEGKSVGEIADELFLSNKTISTYRMRVLQKMRMKKNAEIIIYVLKNKLI